MKRYLLISPLLFSLILFSSVCAAMGPGKLIQMVSTQTTTECVGLATGCTPGTPAYVQPGVVSDYTFVNKFDPSVDGTIKQVACFIDNSGDTHTAKAVVYSGTTKICEAEITLVLLNWAWSADFSPTCTFSASESEIYYGCTTDDDGDADDLGPTQSSGTTGYSSPTYNTTPSWSASNVKWATILKYEY